MKNIISVLRQIYGLRCKSKKGAVLGKQHPKEKLALKGQEQNNGFSAMSADELCFIYGGSGTKVDNPGKMVAASIIATIVTIGNPSELTSAVRDGLYETMGGNYS